MLNALEHEIAFATHPQDPGSDRSREAWAVFVRARNALRDRVARLEARDAHRRSEKRRASLLATRDKSAVVYFVERDGFIKIGTTRQLKTRLAALSRGGQMPEGMTVGPVTLLATIEGDEAIERQLHRRFSENRITGTEWFYPSPELRALVARKATPQEVAA